MPTLHAGVDEATDVPRIVKLTDNQMTQLGFLPNEKPTKLGCGANGCVYASKKADAVVKISKDAQDALAAHLLSKLPGGSPPWAVPVYAVYRLPHNTFAICTAKAEKLPKEWVEPIEAIYGYTDEQDVYADEWQSVYRDIKKEIEYQEIKHGSPTETDNLMRKALELVNDAVLDFRKLGLDWGDFHAYNWMFYSGRPVVIDFGLTKPAFLSDVRYPKLKEIPVLPF